MENFDFRLREDIWVFENDDTEIFHAEHVNGGYYVTWSESDVGADYTIDEVSEYIKEGSWIVL